MCVLYLSYSSTWKGNGSEGKLNVGSSRTLERKKVVVVVCWEGKLRES